MRTMRGIFHGRRARRPNHLSGKAGFPKKRTPFQNRDDGFFALLRDHRQLHLACLDIEHSLRGIPLRKDRVFLRGFRLVFPLPTLVRNSWGLKDAAVRARAMPHLR